MKIIPLKSLLARLGKSDLFRACWRMLASVGLDTRVRASMDQEKLREVLQLKDSQHLMLNNPVGYKKE